MLSLLLSFSSVDDIMHSKGVTGGGEHSNDEINCSFLSNCHGMYLFKHISLRILNIYFSV